MKALSTLGVLLCVAVMTCFPCLEAKLRGGAALNWNNEANRNAGRSVGYTFLAGGFHTTRALKANRHEGSNDEIESNGDVALLTAAHTEDSSLVESRRMLLSKAQAVTEEHFSSILYGRC